MLAFHGFGQSAEYFQPFEVLSSQYTLYCFDLPHHGVTNWDESHVVDKSSLKTFFDRFFSSNDISEFSIAAFSLGGKFLLTLLELYPTKINSLILIAPDGVKVNVWYKLATGYSLFHWIFKFIVNNPSPLFISTDFLRNVGILNKSVLRFIKAHMDTLEKRKQVYLVWNSFKLLKFRERDIIYLINQNNIQSYLYLGKHDRVIPESKFRRFIRSVENLKLFEFNNGHNHLVEHVAKRIVMDLKE